MMGPEEKSFIVVTSDYTVTTQGNIMEAWTFIDELQTSLKKNPNLSCTESQSIRHHSNKEQNT